MTHQGAVLQGYNNELVRYMEDLSIHREEVDKQIEQLLEEKSQIQDEIEMLTKQLEYVCESLAWKTTAWKGLDKTISEAGLAYEKILDSSKMLLTFLKAESQNLDKMVTVKSKAVSDHEIFGL